MPFKKLLLENKGMGGGALPVSQTIVLGASFSPLSLAHLLLQA